MVQIWNASAMIRIQEIEARPTTPPSVGCAPPFIYRKLSPGSRSQDGERTIERLLSVDQTYRLQCRSLYAYLADVLAAKARGDPVPALR
jgi:hypothetical protein